MVALPATSSTGFSVTFWGVRGSSPAFGSAYQRFGGHTSCVEVRIGERLFIIDAGTGLIDLGLELARQKQREMTLLLSHLHLDHISGLPFFEPLNHPETHLGICCGNLDGQDAQAVLEGVFAPPVFPVPLSSMPARVSHFGFKAGETLVFGDLAVRTCLLQHPSGTTAYRFDHEGRSVCYITDLDQDETAPLPADLLAFATGASLVIYDCMADHLTMRDKDWGHSTWKAGVALCRAGGVPRLAAFHHHPQDDDETLLKLEAELQAVLPGSCVAREGMTLTI